jgi:hypothetical protein
MLQVTSTQRCGIRMGGALLLSSVVTVSIAGGQTAPYFTCSDRNLSLAVEAEKLPVRFTELGFLTGTDGTSSSLIRVHVEGEKPVAALALAIEFADKAGQQLTTIAYVAATDDVRETFKPLVHSDQHVDLSKPIQHGETIPIQSYTNIATGECAASAKLVYLNLLYLDASTFSWSAPGWTLGPLPQLLPKAWFVLDPGLVVRPMNFKATMEISPQGRVSSFSTEETVDPQFFQQLRDQVSQWIFFPATVDGNPVNGHLLMLFRMTPYHTSPATLTLKDIVRPSVIVHLIQDKDRSQEWTLMYGIRGGQTQLD